MTNSIVSNNGNDDSNKSPFDAIRGYRADGSEFWTARELMKWLGYTRWEQGEIALNRAIKSIKNQGHDVTENVHEVLKLVSRPSRGNTEIRDYELSRFACYVIAMNSDPEKEIVALAQGYFAIQTYKQEQSISLAPTHHQLPSRELAVETAIAIDKIQDILSKSNPRLAQILIDCAMNDIIEFARPAIASEFPEDRWYGLVQIASKMGIKTDSSTRVKLGQYVGKRVKELNLERVQEERLCNGQYEAIWCYRDNDIVRSVILDWNQQV